MEGIRIGLVDDHRLFRSGIAALIGKLNGYSVHFEAGNGKEMVAKISSGLIPDIILLDISMPVMDGSSAAKWLISNHPKIKIIVLSMFDDADNVLSMIKMGARGYLLKDSDPAEFEQALQKVAKDELYYPEFVTKLLIKNFNHEISQVKLNDRELEFLKLAGSELTYKEIAEKMCVSTRTVDGYRDQLFEKLQIKSRVGLVLYALKKKIIDL